MKNGVKKHTKLWETFVILQELKANFGLTNLIVNDGNIYSNSIKEMKTRGFTISLTFE